MVRAGTDRRDDASFKSVCAVVVPGHQVASGRGGDPRFPGGTVAMQAPFFQALGLDLAAFYSGTVNVSIAPWRYEVVKPRWIFRAVKWHPTARAEDFSFFDVAVTRDAAAAIHGFIYYPHPETKPEHFQRADVLELLLPFVPGLAYGDRLEIAVPAEQMRFERVSFEPSTRLGG